MSRNEEIIRIDAEIAKKRDEIRELEADVRRLIEKREAKLLEAQQESAGH